MSDYKQNMNDDQRFAQVMMMVSVTYDVEFTDALVQVWQMLLKNKYPIAAIEKASLAHMSDPNWGHIAPKPATLIRLIEGTTRSRAAVAVDKLQLAIRLVTARTGVTFDDPLINLSITSLGGWSGCYGSIVDHDQERVHDYLASFIKIYERLANSGGSQHPSYVAGLDDNGSFVLIGDDTAARNTVATGYDPKNPQLTHYSAKQIGNK